MSGDCVFKNSVQADVGNSWVALYTAPSGQSALLLQLNGSVDGAADLVGSARIYDASEGLYAALIIEAPIPTGDTIRLIDQAKIVLEENDRIEVSCDSPGETIDFVCSLVTDINDSELGTYKNAVLPAVDDTWTTLYQAPSGVDSFFLQINAANISQSGVQISARLYDSSEDVYASLIGRAQLPIADAIRLIDGSKIVVESGDRIEVKCDTAGEAVDLVGSLIEDVNQI